MWGAMRRFDDEGGRLLPWLALAVLALLLLGVLGLTVIPDGDDSADRQPGPRENVSPGPVTPPGPAGVVPGPTPQSPNVAAIAGLRSGPEVRARGGGRRARAARQAAGTPFPGFPGTEPGKEPVAPPDCATFRGGTLTAAMTFGVPSTLNPAVSTGGDVHVYSEIMYNGLVELDENDNPVPELALRVVPSADGSNYLFHLRPGVKWHDGNPFTAADVKFSFENALLPFHGRSGSIAPFLESWNPVTREASIDVIDDLTVRFRFKSPYGPLLRQLNVTEAPIIPKHIYDAAGPTNGPNSPGDPLRNSPIGTGAFKFASKDGGVTVVRNDAYFRPDLPCLDRIVMKPFTNEQERKDALVTTRDVEWVWDFPPQFVKELEGNPAFKTARTSSLPGGSNCVDTVAFNLTAKADRRGQVDKPATTPPGDPDAHPVLGDERVRRGLAHAIDRDKYLNNGRSGIGRVADAPLSSEMAEFYNGSTGIPNFDRSRAEELLTAAGWVRASPNAVRSKGGQDFVIDMVYPSAAFAGRVENVRADLAAVGVTLSPRLSSGIGGEVFVNRQFDTTIINYCQGLDPHIGTRRMYHSDQVRTAAFTNAAGYKNADVDKAFDDAARTNDQNARRELYRKFQEQVTKDLPYFWIIETPNVRAFAARCGGFRPYTGIFADTAFCRS